VETLIDSGATVSLINEHLARRLKLKINDVCEADRFRLTSANGSKISVIGTAEMQLYFQGLIVPQTVRVSPSLEHSLVLGSDFLSANNAVLNYKMGIMTLHDDLVRISLHARFDSLSCVTIASTLCIPAYHEALIPVTTPRRYNNKTVLVETLPGVQFNKLAVAKALICCQNKSAVCRILNFNPHVITLKKGMKIAKIEDLNTVASIEKYEEPQQSIVAPESVERVTKEELENFYKEYGFRINPALSEEQRLELLQLLYNYRRVFARSLAEIRPCKNYQLQIDLHSRRKMFRRQFRLSEEDKAEATRQILEMERAQIIQPSDTTEYNSAIFLVRKKDGSRRLVVDLRGINSLIIPKLIQLPKIDELLDAITEKKPRFLSCCDVRSSFWQLELTENSRELTTFSAPDGRRFCYQRVPFGLQSAPSALVLYLANLFADKNRFHSLYIYMDDILIANSCFKTHLEQIKLTLETLQQNNVSLNPKKTELAYSQVEYLGFKISAEGLQLSEKRVEAIKNIKAPKNLKGLQTVLGLVNYWKRSIPKYAARTYHMRQLLRKNTPFVWTDKCQEELEYLKRCLTDNPILRPIDPRKNLICATDGSMAGFGWTWMQEDDDGQLYVVAYGAKSTTPAQQRYTADDLEAIALVYALRSMEPVAIHRKITVITDNSHLLQWASWKPINARQKRMLAYLMMYMLTVVYIKGCRNVQADCLSRLYQDASEFERAEFMPKHVIEDDDFILAIETRSQKRASLMRSDAGAIAPSDLDDSPTAMSGNNETSSERALQPQTAQLSASDEDSTELGPNSEICVDSPAELLDRNAGESTSTDELPVIPDITPADYEDDPEFRPMFSYLSTGQLSGDDKVDKITLLLSDQFLLEKGLLFRLETPKRKRLAQAVPLRKRLCVPVKFRHEILRFAHDNGGHSAAQRLFLMLFPRFYWKHLYADIAEFCRTCSSCLRVKRNFKHRPVPLNPLPVADRPGERWALDFKPLCRPTKAGNTTILCIVDSFTNWPILVPLPEETAEATAYAFVKHVIAVFGLPSNIMLDKGSPFVSTFFSKINDLLNIKHRSSASRTARSNGQAEACVKALIEQLKLHADCDLNIEQVLPLIEMRMRATPNSRTGLSAYELMFGRIMNIGLPIEQKPESLFTGDKQKYYEFLAKEMSQLHAAVKARKEEIKLQDKKTYDKANRVVTPQWAVGQLVLLHDTRVKPGSSQVITSKKFHGPFVIQEVVKGDPKIGQAYKLVRQCDGKPMKNLVTSDRLKAYDVDRTQFTKRLPRLIGDASETAERTATERIDSRITQQAAVRPNVQQQYISRQTKKSQFEAALEIVDEQQVGSKKQYLVRFHDQSVHLCDAVSPLLLKMYRAKKEQARKMSRK